MKKNVKVLLTVLYVSSLLIANIIAAKQVQLPFGVTMTGAIIIFPITYILSDVFSEVYGYAWSRKTCFYAFTMNLLASIMFLIAIKIPYPTYWQNQEAFEIVLGNAPRMLLASFSGFMLGDYINDIVFKKMKEKHKSEIKGFGWRAIISSICGEAADSAIFVPLAFLGQMPLKDMAIMGVSQVALKVAYEVIILPVTTRICKILRKIETTDKNGK